MQKVNVNAIPEEEWTSPKGKYSSSSKLISEALGRDRSSLDLDKRHPFDVETLPCSARQSDVSVPLALSAMGVLPRRVGNWPDSA